MLFLPNCVLMFGRLNWLIGWLGSRVVSLLDSGL